VVTLMGVNTRYECFRTRYPDAWPLTMKVTCDVHQSDQVYSPLRSGNLPYHTTHISKGIAKQQKVKEE